MFYVAVGNRTADGDGLERQGAMRSRHMPKSANLSYASSPDPDAVVATPADRRSEILAVAARLFAERGVVATTVRDIAKEVGILSGSLYHHFDSKETIVDEIIAPIIGDLVRRDEEVVQTSASTLDALEALIRTVVLSVLDKPIEWQIVQNDHAYLGQLERFSYIRDTDARVTRIWTDLLVQGANEDVIRSDVPPNIMYRFLRDSVAMLTRWYRSDGAYSKDDIVDYWVKLSFEGMRSH
jgi:AcrR family transcriptional regulator